jgi:hypothetical protein
MPNKIPSTTSQIQDDVVPGKGPTFKIFTGALKAFERDDQHKYLSCTASSSVEDLHGDIMTDECVMGMAPQAKANRMTIFLNHSYDVPEDVFGKTVDAKIVNRAKNSDGSAIYDLDLEIQLNERNLRAVETYEAIKDQGIKLGVSIGAMIDDWSFRDEDEGFWGGLVINGVDLLEASIVGIPANQRSWVINAITALGAPKAIISKALGRAAPALDATPDDGETDSDEKGVEPEITADDKSLATSASPDDVETPADSAEVDEAAEPTETPSLEDAEAALDSLRAAGADAGLAEILLEFFEGAVEEIASLRTANKTLTDERDQLLAQVTEAAEIVEAIVRTPLGRKAQFVGPVTTFRQKFGGIYDEGIIRLLEGENNE